MYFVVGIYKERGFALNLVSNIGLIQTERETSRSHHPCVQNHPPPLQKISGREDWKKIKIREMTAYSSQGDNTFMCSLNKWRIYTVAQWPFSLVGALFLP